MNIKFAAMSAVAISLAACSSSGSISQTGSSSGSSSGGVSTIGGSSGSFVFATGYANDIVSLSKAGEDVVSNGVLAGTDASANYDIENVAITLKTTDTAGVYTLEYNGVEYDLTQTSNAAFNGREYEAVVGSVTFKFYPNVIADNGQMVSGWTVVEDSSSGDTLVGSSVFGFETDPAFIDIRAGSASYAGLGDVFVRHTSNGGVTAGFGTAALTANFDNGKVSGTISNITDAGGSTNANFEPLSGASATIEQATISGNGFSGDITLDDPSKFYLSDAGTVTYDAKFYEKYGTSVGGYFSGSNATSTKGTGGTALITGTFAAEDTQ